MVSGLDVDEEGERNRPAATKSADLGYFAALGGLYDRRRQTQDPHVRVFPAFYVNGDSIGLGEWLRDDFKFFSIKSNAARRRITKMFHACTDLYYRRVSNACFKSAHDG